MCFHLLHNPPPQKKKKQVWPSRKNSKSVKVRLKCSPLWQFPPNQCQRRPRRPPLPRCRVTWDVSHHVTWSWFYLEWRREKRAWCEQGTSCIVSRFILNINKRLCSVTAHRPWKKNHFHSKHRDYFITAGYGGNGTGGLSSLPDCLFHWSVN